MRFGLNIFHSARVASAMQLFNGAAQALDSFKRAVAQLEATSQSQVEPVMADAQRFMDTMSAYLQTLAQNPNTEDQAWALVERAATVAKESWTEGAEIARRQGRLEDILAWLNAGKAAVADLTPSFGWVPWVAGGALLLYAFLKGRQ